jgi:hypothetical protein
MMASAAFFVEFAFATYSSSAATNTLVHNQTEALGWGRQPLVDFYLQQLPFFVLEAFVRYTFES